MKLFLILFLVPLVSTAEILIPEGGGESTAVYNDAGWDISHNPQAFTVATRCQGDLCPQVVFQRMRFTSMKTFDFIATKPQMNAYEIVSRLGFSQESDAKSFNAARLIVDEIKESLVRRESREAFATRQMAYIGSSEERSLRLLKAQIMAQLADRIRP